MPGCPRKLYVLILFSCFFSGTQLWGNQVVDSLQQLLSVAQDDQERSRLYKKIADQFYEIHQDSTAKYYQISLEYARKSDEYEDDITILRSFAHLYGNRQNNYQLAKKYLKEAYDIAQAFNDNSKLALVKNDLGIMAQKAGDFQEAINCFFDAYHLIQQTHDDKVAIRVLLSLGVIHNETAYHNKAIDYYQQALPIARKVKNFKLVGLLHNNLGKTYRDLNNFPASYQHLNAALSTFDSLQNVYWKGLVLFNLGYNNFEQKNYEKAIEYYQESLKLNQISKEKEREVMLISSLAKVYAEQSQHEIAIEHALKGLDKLKEIATTEYYSDLHEILGKCYQQIGNFEQSSFHLKQHIHYKALRKEEDYSSKIGQLQAMHEAALKAETVKQLELKLMAEEAKQQKTTLLFRLLAISFILAISILALLFYRHRLKQSEKNYQLRNKLARDLHDNIGSSLNHIKIMLNRFKRKVNTEQVEISNIQTISDEVITNMYDLIWSLDKEKEKISDLIEYMRDHASNIFSPLDIPFRMPVNNEEKDRSISPELKNNIYSIYKEAINNIIKHTNPEHVFIKVHIYNSKLRLFIQNDKAYVKKAKANGQHGLINMRKRAKLINGQLAIEESEDTFTIDLTVKLIS